MSGVIPSKCGHVIVANTGSVLGLCLPSRYSNPLGCCLSICEMGISCSLLKGSSSFLKSCCEYQMRNESKR